MTTTCGGQGQRKRRGLGGRLDQDRVLPYGRARPRAISAFGDPEDREVRAVSEFEGTCVLVTGCGRVRGIGRALSVAFARAGADVVATDIATGGTRNENEDGLEEIRIGWKGLESLAGEIQALGRSVHTT